MAGDNLGGFSKDLGRTRAANYAGQRFNSRGGQIGQGANSYAGEALANQRDQWQGQQNLQSQSLADTRAARDTGMAAAGEREAHAEIDRQHQSASGVYLGTLNALTASMNGATDPVAKAGALTQLQAHMRKGPPVHPGYGIAAPPNPDVDALVRGSMNRTVAERVVRGGGEPAGRGGGATLDQMQAGGIRERANQAQFQATGIPRGMTAADKIANLSRPQIATDDRSGVIQFRDPVSVKLNNIAADPRSRTTGQNAVMDTSREFYNSQPTQIQSYQERMYSLPGSQHPRPGVTMPAAGTPASTREDTLRLRAEEGVGLRGPENEYLPGASRVLRDAYAERAPNQNPNFQYDANGRFVSSAPAGPVPAASAPAAPAASLGGVPAANPAEQYGRHVPTDEQRYRAGPAPVGQPDVNINASNPNMAPHMVSPAEAVRGITYNDVSGGGTVASPDRPRYAPDQSAKAIADVRARMAPASSTAAPGHSGQGQVADPANPNAAPSKATEGSKDVLPLDTHKNAVITAMDGLHWNAVQAPSEDAMKSVEKMLKEYRPTFAKLSPKERQEFRDALAKAHPNIFGTSPSTMAESRFPWVKREDTPEAGFNDWIASVRGHVGADGGEMK